MTPATAGPMPVSSRSLLPVYLAHSLVHLYLMLFPAVLFIVKHQFGQSYAILGAVYMGTTMIYGFGAMPVAYWVTRTNPMVLIRLGTLAAAFACLAIAAAPNAAVLAVGLLALGAAASVHHTAAFTHIARVSNNDARLFGHWGAWGNVGLTIAPAFAGILGWLVSWRLPFAAAGVLGLVVSAVLWRRETSPSTAPTRAETSPCAVRATSNVAALAWLFGISMAMGFIYTGFTTYLPAYTGVRASFLPTADVVRGGLVASLVYGIGFFGQWWGGHMGARPHLPRRYTFIVAGNAVLLVGIFASASWLLIAMLIAFSFLHFSTQPLENTVIARFTAQRSLSLVYALTCVVSFGIGSLAAFVGGIVADAAHGHLQWVFLTLAAVAGVATACGIGLQAVTRPHSTAAALTAATPKPAAADEGLGQEN